MMYPLRFEPIFRRYLWGGHRLGTQLGKPIGQDSCAESWEIVDHGQDQSVVTHGPLQGKSLHWLVQQHGLELLGEKWLTKIADDRNPVNLRGRFPLLFKFLDATQNLSVQVHPDDVMGAGLDPPDLGKTEAWYVMHADPGAKIYAGLKPGIGRKDLRTAIDTGSTEDVLHSFVPNAGDCVFIQAGTLHAIGAGLLIAEIQQASNTTFRVFDWNRVDADGRTRDLHIEQSLQATNYEFGPIDPLIAERHSDARAETLVGCDKFEMRKWCINEAVQWDDSRLRILAVTQGQIRLSNDPHPAPLKLADTVMIPASCQDVIVSPLENQAQFLEIVLP